MTGVRWRAALALVIGAFGSGVAAAAPATDFIPPGYVLHAEVRGDLNKDGRPDRVLVIKGTDKTRFVTDPNRGRLDRNRRGLVIVFDRKDGPEPVLVHRDCFSSENEDGGVYFAPELDVSVHKGVLRFHYAHGRYGYWSYDFRWQDGAFALIGHDQAEHRGPVVQQEVSVNLSTRKVLTRVNLNRDREDTDARFKETWKRFTLDKPIRLQDIADFDEFNVLAAIGLQR